MTNINKKRKGTRWWMKDETKIKLEKILSWLLNWVSKVTWEENIKRWVKPWQPLLLKEACEEAWMNTVNFHWLLHNYPEYKFRYDEYRELRRLKIANKAEEVLDSAIWWNMSIEDVDRAKLSLNYLEKVDKKYSVKLNVEQNINHLMLDMSEEDIKRKIMELTND